MMQGQELEASESHQVAQELSLAIARMEKGEITVQISPLATAYVEAARVELRKRVEGK